MGLDWKHEAANWMVKMWMADRRAQKLALYCVCGGAVAGTEADLLCECCDCAVLLLAQKVVDRRRHHHPGIVVCAVCLVWTTRKMKYVEECPFVSVFEMRKTTQSSADLPVPNFEVEATF